MSGAISLLCLIFVMIQFLPVLVCELALLGFIRTSWSRYPPSISWAFDFVITPGWVEIFVTVGFEDSSVTTYNQFLKLIIVLLLYGAKR